MSHETDCWRSKQPSSHAELALIISSINDSNLLITMNMYDTSGRDFYLFIKIYA
jgi:hypothetical protein